MLSVYPRFSIFSGVTCAVLSLLVATPSTPAQASPQPPDVVLPEANAPAYDVLSIKPNNSGSRSTEVDRENDRFSAKNISLKALLADAFDIDQKVISGPTGLLESSRFDIEAKISNPDQAALKKLTSDQQQKMLLPLLTQRLQLRTHFESRTLPIYELVLSKGGLKIKPSVDQTIQNGDMDVNGSRIQAIISGQAVTMQTLAKTLSTRADRTVVDKTGLTGNFDLKLEWSKDDTPDSSVNALPGIFTAIQEQLGLKLQPAKGPVEILVVDHAELPSDN